MREIKFRAWDKRNNRWATFNLDIWGEWQGAKMVQIPAQRNPFDVFEMRSDEQYEWMQFTGLHDKNGKEIYERDIVEWELDDSKKTRAIMEIRANGAVCRTFPYINITSVVIGNIYEHSHLLENPELVKGGTGE